MNNTIRKVLNKLEKQSKNESITNHPISSEEKMNAITPETGLFFNILLKAMNAKRVLEIGTSVGYSTIWLADALIANHKNPMILTMEKNTTKIKKAKKNFRESGVEKIIKIKEGSAETILQEMIDLHKNAKSTKDLYDFVFIDADKENYSNYFDLVLPLVRIGGIITADNLLFPKRFMPIMSKFKTHLRNNPRIQCVTLPIGNGEEFIIKLR